MVLISNDITSKASVSVQTEPVVVQNTDINILNGLQRAPGMVGNPIIQITNNVTVVTDSVEAAVPAPFEPPTPDSINANTNRFFALYQSSDADVQGLRRLVGLGINVNYNKDGLTPLGLAMRFGHEQIAADLIARGANVNGTIRMQLNSKE